MGDAYGYTGHLFYILGTKDGFITQQNGMAGKYEDNLGKYGNQYRCSERLATLIYENALAK